MTGKPHLQEHGDLQQHGDLDREDNDWITNAFHSL
jgi:hypothetical protein